MKKSENVISKIEEEVAAPVQEDVPIDVNGSEIIKPFIYMFIFTIITAWWIFAHFITRSYFRAMYSIIYRILLFFVFSFFLLLVRLFLQPFTSIDDLLELVAALFFYFYL